jgi:hypothetical protein
MESVIPDKIIRLTREMYPSMDFDKMDPKFEFTMRDCAKVERLCQRIRDECGVNAYYWLDGNYDICHWIRTSESRLKPVSRDPRTKPGQIRMGDYEAFIHISKARPLARFHWGVLGERGWQDPEIVPDRLKHLEDCILRQLENEGIEVLPWSILSLRVPGMKGNAPGEPGPPTVYNCLFVQL